MGIKDGVFSLISDFMRPDFDLQFLQFCGNDDLRSLCNIIMYDNDGKIRLSENLSNSDNYLACYPDKMVGMWKDIAAELQCYGGNTVLNCFRGHGPSYESIVRDVCKRMRVDDILIHDTAEEMEQKLLIAVSQKAIGELDESQARAIMEECGIRNYERSKAGLLAALVALQIVNRRLFVIVIETVMRMVSRILIGRGIMYMGMGIFSRGLRVLFGPIGWILMGGWAVWDILGPAYRVTIPAVIQIAYMRVKYHSMLNAERMQA